MGCSSSASLAGSPVESISTEFSPVVSRDSSTEFRSSYKLGAKIGKGAYAQVYAARSTIQKNINVAVKVRTLSSEHSSDSLDHKVCKSACKEVCLWNHVGTHPNCAHMHESFFDDRLCYMVMELCSASLIQYIKNLRVIDERTLAPVFTQMLQGLSHVHSVNVAHRDVKPDNFLVGMDGRTIKLADFGLSAYVPPGGKVDGVCGTAPYMCPEMLLTHASDLKADVWSFGVIVHLLLCGGFPYKSQGYNSKSMKLAIACGRPVNCTRSWVSKSACELLEATLDRDSESRPPAELALRLQFFKESSQGSHNLRTMFASAVRTGAFDSKDLAPPTKVDALLKGEGNACKVLTQAQMDEFITASPEKMDRLVQDFWLPGCTDEKKAEETLSDARTCANSSNSSNASKDSF